MGMAIVVILVCAFGFLVYHKFDLRQQALANIEGTRSIESDDDAVEAAIAAQQNELNEFRPDRTADSSETNSLQRSDVEETSYSFLSAGLDEPEFDASSTDESEAPPFDSEKIVADVTDPNGGVQSTTGNPFDELNSENDGSNVNDTNPFSEAPETMSEAPASSIPQQPTVAAIETDSQDTGSSFNSFEEFQPRDVSLPDEVIDAAVVASQDSSTAAQNEEPSVRTFPTFDPPVPEKVEAPETLVAEANPFPNFDDDTPDEDEQVATPDTQEDRKSLLTATEDPTPTTNQPVDVSKSEIADWQPVQRSQESTLPEETSETADLPGRDVVERAVPENSFPRFPDFDDSADAEAPVDKTADNSSSSISGLIAMAEPSQDVPFNEFQSSPGHRREQSTTDPRIEPHTKATAVEPFATEPIESNETKRSFFADPQHNRSTITGSNSSRPAVPQTIQQVAAVDDDCEICEVQLKDNYWTISKRVYGTARYFSSLALYNQHRIPDPKKLRPGMKVLIPDPKILETKYPELFTSFKSKPSLPTGYFLRSDGSPAYRVGPRETLSEISQKHLGRASRWMQIYRMNQQNLSDPNRLKPGTILLLPEDATNVQVAP